MVADAETKEQDGEAGTQSFQKSSAGSAALSLEENFDKLSQDSVEITDYRHGV